MESTTSTTRSWIFCFLWLALMIFLIVAYRQFFWLALPGTVTHFARALRLF